MDEEPRCLTCKFFDYPDDDPYRFGGGKCRRLPPQAVIQKEWNEDDLEYPTNVRWPIVQVDDWCGEHKE